MDKYVIKVKRKHVCEESNIARKNLKDTDDNEKEYNSNKSEMSLFNHNISEEKNDKISTPSLYENIDINFPGLKSSSLNWQTIKRDNLDLQYTILFKNSVGQSLIKIFEEEFEYFTGDLARVKVFGKWCDIPRKQVTYGDPGLTYKYSGITTPAKPWPKTLKAVRDLVNRVTGYDYNFVLVNRYKDGSDKMGEHKDDEKDLDHNTPIASISLGQPRDFYFRHQDARPPKSMKIEKVSMLLEHGSLLLMNPPTNNFWYHALPPRKSAGGLRINLTFRRILRK
ncbi:DNA oxidative demethylase ALKBH2-like isoform X1 [Penaeus japonicus]|uniref:DNA oxidative demethylase ALKBH2-like isoform X1 n=1 Tax=Penaeus japonicus TaxID=27405 RepID=UPI001C7161BA|nr:DNA oxidative demethylase ALKBH2-like isoform X1 [Penaeus japonicus]XP_042863597.1 DNA oxidative demethylase ALKBH2-like isoform X1 [Penaeus japonicus]XP_042863598.1 DNA oxidative demethylase ALKBH2-like isoform X1 [Penaeus japonicus]